MPIYEYTCPECDCLFEEFQSGFDEKTAPCPTCGCESKRIISNTTFVLKGSGWYVTDYASKKPSANGSNHSAPSASSDGNGNGTAPKKADSGSTSTDTGSSGSGATASTASPATDSK